MTPHKWKYKRFGQRGNYINAWECKRCKTFVYINPRVLEESEDDPDQHIYKRDCDEVVIETIMEG